MSDDIWTDLCAEELPKIDKKYLKEVYRVLRYYRRLPAVENSVVAFDEMHEWKESETE